MRYVIWFIIDTASKFAIGVGLALAMWFIFGLFHHFSVGPWLIAGAILGTAINGFLQGCDVFGFANWLGIEG